MYIIPVRVDIIHKSINYVNIFNIFQWCAPVYNNHTSIISTIHYAGAFYWCVLI